MAEHRFRELVASPLFATVPVASCAFAPCPMFHLFAPSHQAQIQEIYRIATERTREQLRPRPPRIPEFSLN